MHVAYQYAAYSILQQSKEQEEKLSGDVLEIWIELRPVMRIVTCISFSFRKISMAMNTPTTNMELDKVVETTKPSFPHEPIFKKLM